LFRLIPSTNGSNTSLAAWALHCKGIYAMFVAEGTKELFVDFLNLRMRGKYGREVARVYFQMFLLAALCYMLVWVLALPLVHDTPYNLPFRLYGDTFGNFSRWWKFEPILLERERYANPENMWSKLLFAPDSFVGKVQDGFFNYFNWSTTGLVNGPWFWTRFKVGACGFAVALGLFATLQAFLYTFQSYAYQLEPCIYASGSRAYRMWVRWLPEPFLFLEQLFHAREMGRKLSASAVKEIEEREEQEMVTRSKEPGADLFGRPAEADENGVRQR